MAGASITPTDGARLRQASLWLVLATSAVAVSGLFAILIALARVPALGMLFPGADFYRVALTLHVNLSQGVWFMAFAGVLWSFEGRTRPSHRDWLAWACSVCGAVGIALSVSIGRPIPLMSNYLPVLNSPVFLSALALFGLGVVLKAMGGVGEGLAIQGFGKAKTLALRIAALQVLIVFGLLAITAATMDSNAEGHAYFETLFWGSGHVWQFALVSLLMTCWMELAPEAADRAPAEGLVALVVGGAAPVLVAGLVPVLYQPHSSEYVLAYTWLMRWTSWEAPLLMGVLLFCCRGKGETAPGFGLSFLLFVAGLLLGALIKGETTLVTAHYHGTIGAVTLAFMATGFVLLPRLGIEPPKPRFVKTQLALYGYGVLLMMAGLAGAGLMGAPRKTPGDLAVSWSVETVSRICLGVGGVLATAGILMFAWLLLRRLLPGTGMATPWGIRRLNLTKE